MYIPSWVDVPMTILAFWVVNEMYRKNNGVNSIWNRQFMSMAASVAVGAVTVIVNRIETILSVPLFVASAACLVNALYLWKSQPRKLPTEPALD